MKFLLIRYSSLGDVVLTTSVARSIREASPEARVYVLTKDIYTDVFSENPDITGVFTRPVLRMKFDFVIDLHNSLRSNLVKYVVPAKQRLTYNKAAAARRVFLHSGLMQNSLEKTVIQRYLEPVSRAGLDVRLSKPVITITPGEQERAERLTGKTPYIALAPGAKWLTKEWFEDKYTALIIKTIRETGLNTVLIGDKSDEKLASSIKMGTGVLRSHVVNLAGKTGIRDLAAVIKNAKVLITPDTAALHIGWAVSTPVVSLFGPTVKEFGFQPVDKNVVIIEKDLDCRPCSLHGSEKCRYKDRACMQRIEAYEVLNEARKFL